jgi:(1->4)-alpha-D-glucan 1-alpha-D-glucosylmutase
MYRVPLATYRLQFNSSFTFEHARAIVPYLADLGITDVYASPILKARRGSTHGYDVVDPNALNPELGTDEEFDALHETLREHGLGLLLDVVPNHMAASSENAWWMSVLENGPGSRFLHYFDIDWRPVTTAQGETVNKVLLPILGKPYGEAVESQEIQLAFDVDGLHFNYYDKRLPLAPHTYKIVLRECVPAMPAEGIGVEIRDLVQSEEAIANSRFLKETLWRIYEQSEDFRNSLDGVIARLNGEAGNAASFDDLDALLESQWYRLAYWRIATHKINYRRFFDVTDLVGVRIENPEVFEARNRKVIDLIAEGKVTGLRIDHIDGLYDPVGHMRKLQARIGGEGPADGPQPFYVVVEKILAHDEVLPADFAVSGTTGYDFLDAVNVAFVDADGLDALDDFYRRFTGLSTPFHEIAYQRKKQVIHELFSGEMRGLGKQLGELSLHDRNARDFVPSDLLVALTEVTACMDVYRTYVREGEIAELDRARIRSAVACARARGAAEVDGRVFDFIERALLLEPPSNLQHERERWGAFVMRWQQFTGRVMAKGVEDTSFYNYHRLISLNEVGGEPGRPVEHDSVAAFHRFNEQLAAHWPHTMNATSTHDTKRSEDVRARINVLSEIPDIWSREVRKWSRMTASLRSEGTPDQNEELLVYQTLVGMWPLDPAEEAGVPARLKSYLEKAAREAKTHTSWIAPDARFEARLLDYADALLSHDEFRTSMLRLQRKVAFHGFLNSLAQTLLKLTAPGAPDFYQGSELWDYSLVDPDNRRPVDYELRIAALASVRDASPRELLDEWKDGRVKLFTIAKALALRARRAATFRDGAYDALAASGTVRDDDASRHVIAFRRGDDVVVAVPRLTARIVDAPSMPVGDAWGDATLPLQGSWINALTGERIEANGAVPLRELFATFPLAALER